VEFVKESQGGIESLFGVLSTGQWLSIPFILAGLFYLFLAENLMMTILRKKNNS
jgi:prolipoprotein diacylglyceryltransferase